MMIETLTPLDIIFYFFAAIAIGSALTVITARHPVRSVLSLVVTFFAMAGIWMLLEAEFLSLILILVYVGAVMTLFLFVVMMLNIDREKRRKGFVNYLPFAILIVVLIIGLLEVAFGPHHLKLDNLPVHSMNAGGVNNIHKLGSVLYTEYAYPFQIAGVLLLAAIIAAIVLTHRPPTRRKAQNPGDQVSVNPKERVILVKMPAEKKLSYKKGDRA